VVNDQDAADGDQGGMDDADGEEADRLCARENLLRGIELIGEVDGALLGESDQELLEMLDQVVRRLKESVLFLKKVA